MIELEKTNKNKKSLEIKNRKKKKKIPGNLNIVQSRFYDELKLVETEDIRIEFNKLVEEITEQGKRFYKNPLYKELKTYKSMIKKFIEYVTDNMFVVEHYTGGRMRKKIYTLTKIINNKLEALTKLIMSQQKENIDLLSTLDEIRGLLVDLYK